MKKTNLLLLAVPLTLALSSCGGNTDEQSDTTLTDSTAQTSESIGFGDMGSQTYTVPSPNELFAIIKESKLPYNSALISTEPVNYSTSKDQALNFGRLTADIAYTASYEMFQESMANFENLRKVGDDLGISYVFDEFMVSRVKNNMANADSLEVISNDSYERIIGMLDDNEKGSTLAIIAAGGFVESIYLLTHLIGDFSENNDVIQRLADEKFVMENVVDYLKMYEDEDRIKEVLTDLEPVASVFMQLGEEASSEDRVDADKHVILGGSKVIMTKEDFEALKAAATNYRNSFANASQS